MSRRAITVDMQIKVGAGGAVDNVKIDEPPGNAVPRVRGQARHRAICLSRRPPRPPSC